MKRFYNILKAADTWVSAGELSRLLNVSTKTIRNYAKELENVEKSSKGYKLKNTLKTDPEQTTTFNNRMEKILSALLKEREGISVFDLSEQLYVSENTISMDIQQLRSIVANFGLKIVSKEFCFLLEGEERQIRKLIGWLTTQEKSDWFTSTSTLQQLYPHCNVEQMEQFLIQTAQRCGLMANSFAMKNLMSHLIIILLRTESSHSLAEAPIMMDKIDDLLQISCQQESVLQFVQEVVDYCQQITNQSVSENDIQQITALTILSSNLFKLNPDNLDIFAEFIDHDFFNRVIQLIIKMNAYYGLPEMNNVFLCQFILHVYNMYWRTQIGLSYPNPLVQQIKRDHAAIYDVAVWFSYTFGEEFHVTVNEDEIAFIALHLGSYKIAADLDKSRIPCLIVSEDYYGTSRKLIHELHYAFGEELRVIKIAPYAQITMENLNQAELIISSTPFSQGKVPVVQVNPLLTKKDLKKIRQKIDEISRRRRQNVILSSFLTLFRQELYFRNIDAGKTREEVIRFLCSKAERLGYIDSEFVKDVIEREHLSSTAFTDQCAFPHGVASQSSQSFIAVLHNDVPIDWNGSLVNFVLLIGIREQDMRLFRHIFDIVVNCFSNVEQTLELLKSNYWEEFIAALLDDIEPNC